LDFIICSAWLYCSAARGGIGVESGTGAGLAVAALPGAAAGPVEFTLPLGAPFKVAGFDWGELAGGTVAGTADADARGGCAGVL